MRFLNDFSATSMGMGAAYMLDWWQPWSSANNALAVGIGFFLFGITLAACLPKRKSEG